MIAGTGYLGRLEVNSIRVRKNSIKKAKAYLELNLTKVVKYDKKGFFKNINNKIISRENVGPLLNGKGTIATYVVEKVEILHAYLLQSSLPRPAPRNL